MKLEGQPLMQIEDYVPSPLLDIERESECVVRQWLDRPDANGISKHRTPKRSLKRRIGKFSGITHK